MFNLVYYTIGVKSDKMTAGFIFSDFVNKSCQPLNNDLQSTPWTQAKRRRAGAEIAIIILWPVNWAGSGFSRRISFPPS